MVLMNRAYAIDLPFTGTFSGTTLVSMIDQHGDGDSVTAAIALPLPGEQIRGQSPSIGTLKRLTWLRASIAREKRLSKSW
jgi:hypothetical protein